MTDAIRVPFFPLSIVCFPGEQVRLHIFEPRYRQLFSECETDGIRFVIAPAESGGIHAFGTLVELVNVFRRYPGGESDVLVRGVQAVQVLSFEAKLDGKPYPGGECIPLRNDSVPEDLAVREELIDHYRSFHQLIDNPRVRQDFPDADLSFTVGHEIGMDMAQMVNLLSLSAETERQQTIVAHLRTINRAIATGLAAETLRGQDDQPGNPRLN